MSQMQSHPQDDPQAAGNWRKPRRSFSNGNCVEVGEGWRRSRRSMSNGACLEAGNGAAAVLVRDTKQAAQPGRTVLAFTPAAWRAFTDGLR